MLYQLYTIEQKTFNRRRTNSSQLGFYVLIMWLWKEAKDTKVTMKLLRANQVRK